MTDFVGFPKSQLAPVNGPIRCACCSAELSPLKAFTRIIGGVMAYQSCGGHASDAEFLAGALGLADVKPTPDSSFVIVNNVTAGVDMGAGDFTGKTVISRQPARYTANNLALESEIATKQAVIDKHRAKVVALGVELRRPVTARYPSEAKSDRVYESQNPRFR